MLSFPRAPRLFRSASVRLATLYALVFGVSTLALVGFLWWETAGLLNRQVEVAIAADGQSLGNRWEEGGLAALTATIEERLIANVEDDALYMLQDPRGDTIEGNLEEWPDGVAPSGASTEIRINRAGMVVPARVRAYLLLPGGYRLLVGRDVRTRVLVRALLTDALYWALVLVAVLGVAGAVLMRSLFRRMLANVSATAAAISAGDLTRRVRLTGRGDEFDRVAETINDMLDRTARLMDGVRQVSNAIAHDLRTPIARARARLEDAALHARGEAALRAAIERATADLDGVASVFQALLRIAEIEAGARRSAFTEVDLAPSLAELAELYGAVAEEKGVNLILRPQDSKTPALPAYADRDLIQQAVANLLDNAVKFSPPGSEVVLEAEAGTDTVRLAVCDRGPGIPEADRARATERFFRGETARHTPGTGLGLALVHAVAQLHGGELRLLDNGPGLRAELVLPARPAPS